MSVGFLIFEIHEKKISVCFNNFCNNSILLIVLIFATLFATCNTCNKKIYRRIKRALKKWSWGSKVSGRLKLFHRMNKIHVYMTLSNYCLMVWEITKYRNQSRNEYHNHLKIMICSGVIPLATKVVKRKKKS